MKQIKESPFGNTYGSLALVEDNEGNKFLEMDDCFGPDCFGPLTEKQIDAFYVLCEVSECF